MASNSPKYFIFYVDDSYWSGFSVWENQIKIYICTRLLRSCDVYFCVFVQMSVQLRGRVPVPGEYVLVVEYASEDEAPQTLLVSVNSPGERTHQEQITLLHCKYRCV